MIPLFLTLRADLSPRNSSAPDFFSSLFSPGVVRGNMFRVFLEEVPTTLANSRRRVPG